MVDGRRIAVNWVRGMSIELVSDFCVHQASDRVKAAQIPSRPAQPTAMI